MRRKRLLSLVLTLCMVLGMIAVPAYADNTTTISGDGSEAKTGQMTITLNIHGHHYGYTASGATITAKCDETIGGACDISGGKTATLTLVAPAKTMDTDSNSAEATIDGLADFNTATGLSVAASQIEYYSGSTKLDAAPTAKGDYTAKLAVGGATAQVSYSIGTTTQSKSMTITLNIHGHEFGYTASGATITATCNGTIGTCDLTSNPTLTLVAPAKTMDTDSGSAEATIDGLADFNTATGLSVAASQIEYYSGSTKLDAAPTAKGDYTAKLAVGGATAQVSYSIGTTTKTASMTITLTIKPAQTITAADVTATYGDTGKSVSATTSGDGAISYAVKSGDAVTVNAASGALTIVKAGTATVTVTAAETATYAAATKDVTVTINKAEVTVTALDQNILVGGTVPDLSAPVLDTHYTVTGLVGEDTLMTAPTLDYQKDGSAATPDNTTAGTYDIVPSGAAASDNYTITYANGTLTISDKGTQTISAEDVTATYGDMGKSVSATTSGDGAISYAVKSGDAVTVDASTGALTIVKAGSATVTVTAAETDTYAQATKDVTVTVNKADITPTVTLAGWYAGSTANAPVLGEGSNPGNGDVTYTYKAKGAADDTYSADVPTAIGNYTVKATVAETDNYNGGEATADFTISSMPYYPDP